LYRSYPAEFAGSIQIYIYSKKIIGTQNLPIKIKNFSKITVFSSRKGFFKGFLKIFSGNLEAIIGIEQPSIRM
jgi:hypothetical protein